MMLAADAKNVFFFEESIKTGGVGETFAALLEELNIRVNFRHIAVNDEFIKQASVASQLKKYSLDSQGVLEVIRGEKQGQA